MGWREYQDKHGWRPRGGFRYYEGEPIDQYDRDLEAVAIAHGLWVKWHADPHGLFSCGPFDIGDDGPAMPDHDMAEALLIQQMEKEIDDLD